jgi:hypothetical protein
MILLPDDQVYVQLCQYIFITVMVLQRCYIVTVRLVLRLNRNSGTEEELLIVTR